MIKIDTRKFYNIGVWLFGIVAIMNTATFIQNIMDGAFSMVTQIISTLGSIAFNYLIFGFFFYLRSTLPPKDMVVATDEEMLGMLKSEEKE